MRFALAAGLLILCGLARANAMDGRQLLDVCQTGMHPAELQSAPNDDSAAHTCFDYIEGAADLVTQQNAQCLGAKPAIPLGVLAADTIAEIQRRGDGKDHLGSWFVERTIFDKDGCKPQGR